VSQERWLSKIRFNCTNIIILLRKNGILWEEKEKSID